MKKKTPSKASSSRSHCSQAAPTSHTASRKSSSKVAVKTTTSAVHASNKKGSPKVARRKTAPTPEQIALRAYFISERRHELGWEGDVTTDWMEAERQLLDEAKK